MWAVLHIFTFIGLNHKPVEASYDGVHGQALETVDSVKYLGFTVNSKLKPTLTWFAKSQMAHDVSWTTTYGPCGRNITETTYKTYAGPVIKYIYMHKLSGIPTQTIINKLEQVQQYVACYILVTCNSSINNMLTRSPVADLGRACRQTQLIMMFKMFKQQVDINPAAYLQLLQSDTSHFITECSCPACTNSFFRHTTWDWNTLAIDPLLCHTAGSEVIWLPTNVSAFLFLEMWCTQPLCTSPLCEAQSTEDDDCNSFTYTT